MCLFVCVFEVLPSYQEAISSASLPPPAVVDLSVDQFAPPPYSASDSAAATDLARLAPPPPPSPPVQCSENRAASTTETEEQQMTLPITCITSSSGVHQLVSTISTYRYLTQFIQQRVQMLS